MWIRTLEWRSATDTVRATTPRNENGLGSGELDASNVADTFAQARTTAAGRHGELVVELVEAGEDDCELLVELLNPLDTDIDRDAITYLLARSAPTSGGTYRFDGDLEVHEIQSFRAAKICRLLPPVHDDHFPSLYATEIRIVVQDAFVLINWMSPAGYPEPPNPARVAAATATPMHDEMRWPTNVHPEGPADRARKAGVDEEVIAFEWGPHSGSLRQLPKLDGAFGESPSAPRRLAEHLIAGIAATLGYAASECSNALQSWEATFLAATGAQESESVTTPDSYRRLAAIANLAAAVRSWNDELNQPSDHDPVSWFAATPDSQSSQDGLDSNERVLERVRDDCRTALTVAAGIATSQQLELQTRREAQSQAFERAVALVGSVILVPGLVATFYGTNVPLPAGSTWWGTALLVVLMALSGLATWIALNRARSPS